MFAMSADFESSSAVVVTNLGLSVLKWTNFTLQSKADLLEQIMVRHQQTSQKNLPNGSFLGKQTKYVWGFDDDAK